MVLRKLMGLVVCVMIISSVSLATAGVPDLTLTLAGMNGVTTEIVALFNLPNAGGNSFAEAAIWNDGTPIDATITMTVLDGNGAAVKDLPAEDMWLASIDGGMVPCTGGSAADFVTNDAGQTSWANPMNAGGYSTVACQVIINGLALNQDPFALYFNSADMNGDGAVDLPDVGLFSGVFYGAYHFSADFVADGSVDLPDVGLLARGSGTSCP